MEMDKKRVITVLLVLGVLALLLSGCTSLAESAFNSLYDEPADLENSLSTLDYLFSEICPYIDAATQDTIRNLFTGSLVYQRAFAYREGDSVIITNMPETILAEITEDGISITISYDLIGYSGKSSEKMKRIVLEDNGKDLCNMDIPEGMIKITYNGESSKGHMTCALPDEWNKAFVTFGDGARHSVLIRWEGNSEQPWRASITPPNQLNKALLRVLYLIDQQQKNHEKAITEVTDYLNSMGSKGRSMLASVRDGSIAVNEISDALIVDGDDIVLERQGRSWYLFLRLDVPSEDVRSAVIFLDDDQYFIPIEENDISGNIFEICLNDSDLLSYIRGSRRCSVEFYDSGYYTIGSEQIISTADQLIMDFYFTVRN